MKYLTFIRHSESYRQSGPPAALMEAMGQFVQKSLKDGVLVDTGGLLPSKDGVRVRLAGGKLTVTDGPFTEMKEVIGGWAILQTDSRGEANRTAPGFMGPPTAGQGARHDRWPPVPLLVHGARRRHAQAAGEGRSPRSDRQAGGRLGD